MKQIKYFDKSSPNKFKEAKEFVNHEIKSLNTDIPTVIFIKQTNKRWTVYQCSNSEFTSLSQDEHNKIFYFKKKAIKETLQDRIKSHFKKIKPTE